MTRLATTADRLTTGSSTLARRLKTRAQAWITRGRRDDLTGWRASLGCWLRLLTLALAAYALVRLVRAVPTLMWLLSTVWITAAWRAGRPAPKTAEDTPEDPAEQPDKAPAGEAARRLLLEVMGQAPAVHLRTVLAHLQEHGQWEGRTVSDLRRRLERLEIPVDRRVKVGGVPTWGVRRRDLEAPSPTDAPTPSTEPSTAA